MDTIATTMEPQSPCPNTDEVAEILLEKLTMMIKDNQAAIYGAGVTLIVLILLSFLFLLVLLIKQCCVRRSGGSIGKLATYSYTKLRPSV
jgi:hypothetical protein